MIRQLASPPARLLLVFGALSLAAVLIGAAVVVAHGAPGSGAARNLAAWLVGAIAATGLAALIRGRAPAALAWIAPAALLATFAGQGLEGVHRWLALGPVQANMAMLALPLAVVAFAANAASGWPAWTPILLALPILAWQPDASQATALAAAAMASAMGLRRHLSRLAVGVFALACATGAWLRPDPLAPQPEVEGVIGLAWTLSPILAGLALLLLLAVAAAPAALCRDHPAARLPGFALTILLAAWMLTPFLGAFPVPFAGVSPSPILGAWLGAGLLAGLLRRPA